MDNPHLECVPEFDYVASETPSAAPSMESAMTAAMTPTTLPTLDGEEDYTLELELVETTPCVDFGSSTTSDIVFDYRSSFVCRTNGCHNGCCRATPYLVCDTTNAFPNEACVCNEHTQDRENFQANDGDRKDKDSTTAVVQVTNNLMTRVAARNGLKFAQRARFFA